MFDDLLLHPRTKLQLTNFLSKPSHGVILTGSEGSGKRTLAMTLACGLLDVKDATKLLDYPYYSELDPESSGITIDEIRSLQKLLTLKTPTGTRGNLRRVITILDAQRMQTEAQNALLKNLEEPPLDTAIILTASGGNLLPTIYSRLQTIEVLPVSQEMAVTYFTSKGVGAAKLAGSYALSQGQAGLLSTLLNDEEHKLKNWVTIAKQLIGGTLSERLIKVDELGKDKSDLKYLIDALQRIAHAALSKASLEGNKLAVQRWRKIMTKAQDTSQAYDNNANPKLLLDDLFLNL